MQAFHFKSFNTVCHEKVSVLSSPFSECSSEGSFNSVSSFSTGSDKKRSEKSRTRYSVRLGGGDEPIERSSPSDVSEPLRQRSSFESGSMNGMEGEKEVRPWSLRECRRVGCEVATAGEGGLWDDAGGLARV